MADETAKEPETVKKMMGGEETKRTPEEIEYDEELRRVSEAEKKGSENFSLWFILVIFLVVGLPVWLKTTTPERWDLPNVSILSERSKSIKHHYKVSVIFFENSQQIADVKSYFQIQQKSSQESQSDKALKFVAEYNVRQAFQREADHYQKWKSNDIRDLDEIFSSQELQKNNHLIFYVLPANIPTDNLIHYGQSRNFFIDTNHFNSSESFHSFVYSLISEKVKASQDLAESFYLNLNKNDQRNLLLLGREFEFVFDILFEDENSLFKGKNKEEINRIREQLNLRIHETFQKLVSGFYSRCGSLSSFFRMNFVSQVFHYVLPDNYISNNLSKNSSSINILELPKVHKIFDYVESKRVDHGNENAYHLLLLMTNDLKLQFADPKNSEESSILITTPFRGSILVDNADESFLEGFQHFLHQFFHLHHFRQHQIESMVRSIAQKQIIKTLQSLEATEKLLKTVSNIVIEQKISQRMQQSFSEALSAIEMLEAGTDISSIFDKSHSAYILSEKAFYDPSLLSLLYFPDDQKYAIYLPLFLPIGLPLVMNAIRRMFKKFKDSRKVKTD